MALNYIGRLTWANAGEAAATKVMTGIPQTFDDLLLLFWVKSESGNSWWDLIVRLNQDADNHRHQIVYRTPGDALQPLWETTMNIRHSAGSGQQAWGQAFVHIQNYTSASPKTFFGEQASEIWSAQQFGGYFGGAITSLSAFPAQSVGLIPGSRIDVYGIKYNQNTLTATQS